MAGTREAQALLPLIDMIGLLLDEALAHQRRDDAAHRRPLDREQSDEVSLHRRPDRREAMKHIPLDRAEIMRP
ncbi:hypothetical protein D3C72_2457970 [compost metagenome]